MSYSLFFCSLALKLVYKFFLSDFQQKFSCVICFDYHSHIVSGTEERSKDPLGGRSFVIFQMVIPAQIASLTGALVVQVIRLNWSLIMISYTSTISAGIGGLTWITSLALLCRELIRGITLFFFLIVFLTGITVTRCVLHIHALKQGNNFFPFAACSELTLLHRVSRGPTALNWTLGLGRFKWSELLYSASACHSPSVHSKGFTGSTGWLHPPVLLGSVSSKCSLGGQEEITVQKKGTSLTTSYIYNTLKNGANVSTSLTPGVDEVWC